VIWKTLPGLYLGWGLGATHAANVFGPQVASETISYRRAVFLTAIFIFIGALVEGSKCFGTIGSVAAISVGMAAVVATLAAALVVHLMLVAGLPVSSSQAIVGALIGVGISQGNHLGANTLVKLFVSWILTPVGAAVVSYLLYRIIGRLWESRVRNVLIFNRTVSVCSIAIGCYAAYSLGANNLANTTGIYVSVGYLSPFLASLLGGLSMAAGVATCSRKVMFIVGKKITSLEPFAAMIVVLAGAITLHLYAQLGVPVSSSQAIVGAVVGVGMVKGARTVNRRTLVSIIGGWVFTVLGTAVIGYCLGSLIT